MHTNSDEKVFYMKNHLLEKLHPNLTGGTLLNIFKILKNLTEKKVTGLLRSRVEKIEKISNYVVKLWSNNGQTNYSRILVLLNNYFSFLNFGQIWSIYDQTVVKLIIQEILVLLIFRTIVSNSNSEMCDFMLKLNS